MRVERSSWDGERPARLAASIRSRMPAGGELSAQVRELVEAVRDGGDRKLLELIEQHDGVRIENPVMAPEAVPEALARLDPALREALELAASNIRMVAEAQVRRSRPGRGRAAPGTSGARPGGAGPLGRDLCAGRSRPIPLERADGRDPGPGGGGRASRRRLATWVLGSPRRGDPRRLRDRRRAGGLRDGRCARGRGARLRHRAGPPRRRDRRSGWTLGSGGEARGREGCRHRTATRVPPSSPSSSTEPLPLEWIALDLCAQAEHGTDGPLVAISVDPGVLAELTVILQRLAPARPSVSDAIVFAIDAPNPRAAVALCDALAPEHLQLACAGAPELARSVRTAGCVFVGASGGTAFGDYAAGSNHAPADRRRRSARGSARPGDLPAQDQRRDDEPRVRRRTVWDGRADCAAEGFTVHGESARARGPAGQGDRENERR